MENVHKSKLGVLKLSAMIVASLCFTACASYRNVEKASNQAQLPNVKGKLSEASRFSEQTPVANWWMNLDDSDLTGLIETALLVNHDLRIALSSVNESRAILRRANLEYIPSVTASLSATREKQSGELTGVTQRVHEYYDTGLDASWELDLFGRIRNQVKLSNTQLRAREADFNAVQISLAAEVAAVYLSLRGNQQLIDIAQRSVELQDQNLQLVQKLTKVGRTSTFDLSRAKAQLELTAARLPSLQQDYQLSLSRLSVLTVTPVKALEEQLSDRQQLPSIPASVAVGNLSDLLKRRPDVIRAEQALQGATAEYNLHVADLYPRMSFTGSFGFLSSSWSELGKKDSEAFRFTPSIHWAALDLTRVKSLINAADAKARGRLASFEQTVLVALKETDDAFTRFSSEELRMQHLLVAATESSKAAEFSRKTYQGGRGDLRDVLDAEQVRLSAVQQLVQSEMTILLNLVDIYKNLGGGWEIASIDG